MTDWSQSGVQTSTQIYTDEERTESDYVWLLLTGACTAVNRAPV